MLDVAGNDRIRRIQVKATPIIADRIVIFPFDNVLIPPFNSWRRQNAEVLLRRIPFFQSFLGGGRDSQFYLQNLPAVSTNY